MTGAGPGIHIHRHMRSRMPYRADRGHRSGPKGPARFPPPGARTLRSGLGFAASRAHPPQGTPGWCPPGVGNHPYGMADMRLSDLGWLPAVRIKLEEDVEMLDTEDGVVVDAVALVGGWIVARSPDAQPRLYPAHRVLYVNLAEDAAG